MVTMMMQLTVEREDGTLLRAKAIPRGMLGYLVGKVTLVSSMTLLGVLLQVPAMVAVPVLPLTYYLRTTYITRSRERDPGQ